MATFTALADWTSGQDRTAANQIVQSYSEHKQVIGESAIDALVTGDNVQDTTFWRGMQEWIEAQITPATTWIDHSATITSGDTTLPYYTLSSFRTAASIPSGFRRATAWPTDWTDYEDPAYSYGVIQSGDIVGPWIYEDLQQAFDMMRMIVLPLQPVAGTRQSKEIETDGEATYAAASATIFSAWGSSQTTGWVANAYYPSYGQDIYVAKQLTSNFSGSYGIPDGWFIRSALCRVSYAVSVSTIVPNSGNVYLYGSDYNIGGDPYYNFYDYAPLHAFKSFQTIPQNSTAVHTIAREDFQPTAPLAAAEPNHSVQQKLLVYYIVTFAFTYIL